MQELKYVGKTYSIHDAEEKAKGETEYASDIKLNNMLHAALVLSSVPHAKIKSMDFSKALCLEGVVSCFSCFNTTSKKYNSYRKFPKLPNSPDEKNIFPDRARHVGDAIAAVVALDFKTAQEAVRLVKVEYEELAACVSTKDSMLEKQPLIHDTGNLSHKMSFRCGRGAVDFDKDSSLNFTAVIKTQKTHHLALENHCYLADYSNKELTIWTPTQGIFGVRTVVAELLEMPYNKVRVIKVPMGGSFGGKQEFIHEPMVAWMAKELGRPVRLNLNRKESMLSTVCRSGVEATISMDFTKDGDILDSHTSCVLDGGAYSGNAVAMIYAMKSKITRLYRFPSYSFDGYAVHTNTLQVGGMRGWGSPEMGTVFEIYMDQAAKKLGFDPVEMRLRNMSCPFDVDAANGISLGDCKAKECLRIGADAFGWKERSAQNGLGKRKRFGVGLACSAHNNGMYNTSDLSTMTIRMNEDGTVQLVTSLHEVGCGTLRSMQIIAGEVLQIYPDEIRVTEGDTKYSPYDLGSYGSRVTYVSGRCAYDAANALKDMLIDAAAGFLSVSREKISLSCGKAYNAENKEEYMSYADISLKLLMEEKKELVKTVSFNSISNPASYAANFVEVEVDTLTGLVEVKEFLSVNDIGQALNRGMVYRQVQGAVQMALGYGVREELEYDTKGYPVTTSLKKYHPFNSADMPRVKTILIEDKFGDGPFGAKGIGESATVAGAAAVVNAINNALGTSITELPLTPERILKAIAAL